MLTSKALSNFGQAIVDTARANLKSSGKVSTGNLYRSLDWSIDVSKETKFTLEIEMADYGEIIDKGINGTEVSHGSPFSYTNKRPPSSAFDGWSVRKGIAPRDSKGKFLKRKSLSYIIAKSVFEKGIKPSFFFTKAFNKEFNSLPDEVAFAYSEDIENIIEESLRNN
tara:strand:+ start:9493 stop:9993 length:501 start_codon:yes stop_codon:yes gene_type:complete